MSSRSEQILQQIVTQLNGSGGIGCTVYRSRMEYASERELSFAVVAPGPDKPIEAERTSRVCLDKLDQRFMVAIAIYARRVVPSDGTEPQSFDQVADPIKVAVHQKLMADRSLGGLAFDVTPAGWTPEVEASNGDAGMIICEYVVRYRTSANDISVG